MFGAYGNYSCGMGFIADPFKCGNTHCRMFSILNSKCQAVPDELFSTLLRKETEKAITEQLTEQEQ